MKQNNFNEKIQGQLHDNTLAIKSLLDVLGRTVNDVKCIVEHFHMVQTQLEQISNVQKYLLANNAKQDNLQAYGIKTRGGTHTQDPLYPEGHPKRIEQDSQVQEEEIVSSPKKKKNKKKHKEADNSNDPIQEEEQVVDPNNISTSDAETEDGAEPEKDAEKNDPPEVREEEAPDKLIRPKCITILYFNFILFIDIFHFKVLFLFCFGLFYIVYNFPVPKQQNENSTVKSGHQVAESDQSKCDENLRGVFL